MTLEQSCSTTTPQGGTTTEPLQPVETPLPTINFGSVDGVALCLTPPQRALAQRAVTAVGNVLKHEDPGTFFDSLVAMEAIFSNASNNDLSFAQLRSVLTPLPSSEQHTFLTQVHGAFCSTQSAQELIFLLYPVVLPLLPSPPDLLRASRPAPSPSPRAIANQDFLASFLDALPRVPCVITHSEAEVALSRICPSFYAEPIRGDGEFSGTGAVRIRSWASCVSMVAPFDYGLVPSTQDLKLILSACFSADSKVPIWLKSRADLVFGLGTVVASRALGKLISGTDASDSAVSTALVAGCHSALLLLLTSLKNTKLEHMAVSAERALATTPPDDLLSELIQQLDVAFLPLTENLNNDWDQVDLHADYATPLANCKVFVYKALCKPPHEPLSFEEYVVLVVNLATDLGKPFCDIKSKLLKATRYMQRAFPDHHGPFSLTAKLQLFTRLPELHAFRREFSDICQTALFKAVAAPLAPHLPEALVIVTPESATLVSPALAAPASPDSASLATNHTLQRVECARPDDVSAAFSAPDEARIKTPQSLVAASTTPTRESVNLSVPKQHSDSKRHLDNKGRNVGKGHRSRALARKQARESNKTLDS